MTATHVLSEHDQSEQERNIVHVRSIYAVHEGATIILLISEASRHVELNVPPVFILVRVSGLALYTRKPNEVQRSSSYASGR